LTGSGGFTGSGGVGSGSLAAGAASAGTADQSSAEAERVLGSVFQWMPQVSAANNSKCMNKANDKERPNPPVGGGANSLCAMAFMRLKKNH
jgi:hypothetical protein